MFISFVLLSSTHVPTPNSLGARNSVTGLLRANSQSAPRKLQLDGGKFDVPYFKPKISGERTIALEWDPSGLNYYSPFFTVNASVSYTLPKGTKCKLGFVQLADFLKQRTDYSRSFLTWENPKSPNLDSDGADKPWYSSVPQVRSEVVGDGKSHTANFSYWDRFDAFITWKETRPDGTQDPNSADDLSRVVRDEQCSAWLVAIYPTGMVKTLKRVTWRIGIDITVDASRPYGERSTVNQVTTYTPVVTDGASIDPGDVASLVGCLNDQPAGQAEQLWWNPKRAGIGSRQRIN